MRCQDWYLGVPHGLVVQLYPYYNGFWWALYISVLAVVSKMLILVFRFLLYLLFVGVARGAEDKYLDYAVKESHPLPGGWSCLERAASYHEIELQIGLSQSRFDELEQALYESVFFPKRSGSSFL